MKESDIRPAELMAEYLKLSLEDAKRYFSAEGRLTAPCVGCGGEENTPAFTKSGFDYVRCDDCGTLFLSPRPSAPEFFRFYEDSPSSSFWANEFFPKVSQNRRELIFAPRVTRIAELCRERGLAPNTVIDVGAGYGMFLEEWKKAHPASRVMAVEPGQALADVCRGKGIEVLQTVAEEAQEWKGQGDLVVCFEVLEHTHDPLTFVQSLRALCKPGGTVLVSSLCADGFDIQTLWEKSKSVCPPHHINFLSVDGFQRLFERAGLSGVEVITPGKLDVDIVKNSLNEEPESWDENRFLATMLRRGDAAAADFQAFLVKHRLSSHAWMLGKA